ncbi:MAG: MBL fold metallo-hydrolase [Parafilimonas sp.]
MKVNLWGVRGSIQTSGPETKNYGSRTSCVMVSEDDNVLILDAGSGIQQFNSNDYPNKRVDVLLTHLHMDHILGLGFFSPFFDPGKEVHLWGPTTITQTLRARLSRYLSPPLFPVLLRDLPCKLVFHEIGNNTFQINHFKIMSGFIIHPGPTVGFRVMGKQSVFTYIPDHEPALGRNGMIKDRKWISGYDLAAGADLLYHDGQYTDAEYQTKKGWGHSSMKDALLFASFCRAKKLLIAHHDPSHTDELLNNIFKNLQSDYENVSEYAMAEEGMQFNLP